MSKQEFIEALFLKAIAGGGFETWRSRRWHYRTVGYERATREDWVKEVTADALAAWPEIEQMNAKENDMDLIEQVSDKVHENWMAAKRQAGVTTRKLESGEELMVPYAQLSEQAKDLDRGTVRTVIGALRDLGHLPSE